MQTFSFEHVYAWQKAHEFTILVYQVTRIFPKEELFGLTSQFRRAAVSIEANIAEGYKKLGKSDKLLVEIEHCASTCMSALCAAWASGDAPVVLFSSVQSLNCV